MSMGISLYPDNGSNYLELYENADHALRCAKIICKGSQLFFDETKEEGASRSA